MSTMFNRLKALLKQCSSDLPVDILDDVARAVTLAQVGQLGAAEEAAGGIIHRIERHTGLSSAYEGVILPTTGAPEVPTGEMSWSTFPPPHACVVLPTEG